jgi:large subunit ribosomal protein L17
MRHQNRIAKLGRTNTHRKATLSALSTALITHKRITTTLPKAKALRMFVEPILTRAKADTTQNRRQVFRRLQDKYAVTELFTEIAGKIAERPGGYCRIVKLGQRAGDSAEMAVIELVDYNDTGGSTKAGAKKRRTRRGSAGAGKSAVEADESVKEAASAVAEKADDVVEAVAEKAEDAVSGSDDEAASDQAEGADVDKKA